MHNFRSSLLALVLLVTGAAQGFAQTTLSLQDALSTALKNNYGIRIASEQLTKLQNDETPGNAGMLPVVNLDGSRNFSITDVNQTFQDGRVLKNDGIKANSYNIGPRLEWTLFDGMAMFVERDRLSVLREMGELVLRSRVEGTVADVTITYYDLARQQQLVLVLEESIEISRQRLNIAEDKYDVGSGARVEVLQAQVALNEDVSAWKNQGALLINTRSRLNLLMGIEPTAEIVVDDGIVLSEQLDYPSLRASAMESNPELLLGRKVAVESRLFTRIQQATLLPQVNLSMAYTMTGSQNSASIFTEQNNRGLSYGLTARVPLFDGLNRRRVIENARLDEKIASLELESMELEVEAQLYQAWTDYANALELVMLEEQNLLVAQENAAIALDRFQLGTYTPVELREAQQALLNTENRLVFSKFSAKASETRLLLISGKLNIRR